MLPRKLWAAAAGAPLALLALVLLAMLISSTGKDRAAASTPGSDCTVATAGNGGSWQADGIKLDAEQMNNARIEVATVKTRTRDLRAAEITLMTSYQEARLKNLNYGDAAGPDSHGLFQQRDSWGPLAVRMDPAGSTNLFLNRLLTLPDLDTAPADELAHRVQGNQRASDYTPWISMSKGLTAALWGDTTTTVTCSGGTPAGAGGTSANAKIQTVLNAAKEQLGLPYCWAGGTGSGPTPGADCPAGAPGFDCSGLALYAYAQVGITIPHQTGQIFNGPYGRKIPITQVQPGDLVFLSNPADPIHHVAIIWSVVPDSTTGAGQIIEAQTSGVPIHIRDWKGASEPQAMDQAIRLVG